MSVLRTGVHGIDCHGVIPVTYMGTGALGLPPLDFDEAACTFTAGMAKRDTSGNVFAASPIVQGDWGVDDANPDSLTLGRGAAISGDFYANIDPYQGSVVFWITPEWDGGEAVRRTIYRPASSFHIYKEEGGNLRAGIWGATGTVNIAAWTAGTRYCVVIRWDSKNLLDGTNYICISINGVHTFGPSTAMTVGTPTATGYIGMDAGGRPANAVIEGLTVYRRPLWDGDYGVDCGNGDEIALISAGVDPCTVTGSWDICACVPTNAAVGALVTGTGEAWSHPHAAAETNLTDAYCQTAYAASAWADEGTPVTPAAYDFDGSATSINCGSNAALDDLASQPAGKGTLTAEAWVRADGWGESSVGFILSKWAVNIGWVFHVSGPVLGLRAVIECATTDARSESGSDDFAPDGRLHHVAMTWNDTGVPRHIRLFVDGIEVTYVAQVAGVGAAVLDAAQDFIIGNDQGSSYTWDGKIAWARLSDTIRYASPFVPPPLTNPPAVDGNTVEQWDFTDCAGASVTASVNPGAPPGGCDGQITAGAGGWNCVKDMDDFAVGDRGFQWGYIFGSDAANEGITQTAPGAPLTAGQNYALRVPVNLGADSTGRARIRVRDMTNAANIVDFDGPLMTGLHTGANNSATLIVAGARFPQSLIGATVYNITDVNPAGTDCSSATITAVSGDGTTITAALAGGTDADWDTNDVFRIVWHRTGAGVRSMPADHPWCEPFTLELPTNARHGVGADCVSISVKVLNSLASGTVMVHQIELLENLIDNPSLEAPWAGGPPAIPAGWANVGLDPGDIQTSSTGGAMIHSGAEAAQWNIGASNEYVRQLPAGTINDFYMFGIWNYGDGAITIDVIDFGGNSEAYQYNLAGGIAIGAGHVAAVWGLSQAVVRSLAGPTDFALRAQSGASGTRYLDDCFIVALDNITLTATPANQGDSAEAPGLRIDGRDTCPQPIPAGYWAPTSGWTRWHWTPRHDAAQLVGFDEAANVAVLVQAFGNATNYIQIRANAANQIELQFNDGGGAHTVNWACAGQVVAATTYLMEVRYTSSDMWLTQDGVERARITTPLAFAVTPTNVYWGSRQAGDRQVDAVYGSP